MTLLTMYGADWCGDCRRSKKVLDASGIDYTYIDVETDAKAAETVKAINGGKQSIPVILFPDGTHLTEPSDHSLLEKLQGLKLP
jgi:mycoredoxin